MAIVSMSYAEMNPKTAEQITYDNSTSGLSADNVQDAIDEVVDNTSTISLHAMSIPSVGSNPVIRYGKIVVFQFNTNSTTSTINSGTTLYTLPSGYIPRSYTNAMVFTVSGGTMGYVTLDIDTSGNVITYSNIPAGTTLRGSTTYVTNDPMPTT